MLHFDHALCVPLARPFDRVQPCSPRRGRFCVPEGNHQDRHGHEVGLPRRRCPEGCRYRGFKGHVSPSTQRKSHLCMSWRFLCAAGHHSIVQFPRCNPACWMGHVLAIRCPRRRSWTDEDEATFRVPSNSRQAGEGFMSHWEQIRAGQRRSPPASVWLRLFVGMLLVTGSAILWGLAMLSVIRPW